MLQDLLEDCGGLSWNAAGSDCSSDSESTGYVTASGRKQKFLSTKLLRKQIWSNAKSIGQEYDDEVYGRCMRDFSCVNARSIQLNIGCDVAGSSA